MRVARCWTDSGIRYGIIEGDTVELLAGRDRGCGQGGRIAGRLLLGEVKLLAPCLPSKIVAAGINYAPHAAEIDFAVPEEPLIFIKPSTSVVGPDDAIVLPAMSGQVEYEGELAVVIGRVARNLSEDEALAAVFGYTCINDVTARDLQKRDGQFTRSKGFDTFAPLGPWIETDLDPADLTVETVVNGKRRQFARTGTMIRSVPALISFTSKIMTLLPGDVIATGTPAGVGVLHAGDIVSVTVDKIGTLTNRVENHDSH